MTVVHQAPLSMQILRQEYWSELPCPPPGALPDPGSNLHLLGLLPAGSSALVPSGLDSVKSYAIPLLDLYDRLNSEPE